MEIDKYSKTKAYLHSNFRNNGAVFLLLVSITGAKQDSDGWFNKGNALSDLNKSDEAIKAYDKAIEINPQNSIAWNNKGALSTYMNKSKL